MSFPILDNQNIEKLLCDFLAEEQLRKIIPAAREERDRLTQLRLKGQLDFGPKIKEQDLPDLLEEVKTAVDSFIGVSGPEICQVRFRHLRELVKPIKECSSDYWVKRLGETFIWTVGGAVNMCAAPSDELILPIIGLTGSCGLAVTMLAEEFFAWQKMPPACYRPLEQIIISKVKSKVQLIPALAHEYTHHIQFHAGLRNDAYSMLKEGFAQGIERHIAAKYAQKEHNEAFLYHSSQYVENFIETLQWIKASRRELQESPECHALGDVFFTLLERASEHSIYKECLETVQAVNEQASMYVPMVSPLMFLPVLH